MFKPFLDALPGAQWNNFSSKVEVDLDLLDIGSYYMKIQVYTVTSLSLTSGVKTGYCEFVSNSLIFNMAMINRLINL